MRWRFISFVSSIISAVFRQNDSEVGTVEELLPCSCAQGFCPNTKIFAGGPSVFNGRLIGEGSLTCRSFDKLVALLAKYFVLLWDPQNLCPQTLREIRFCALLSAQRCNLGNTSSKSERLVSSEQALIWRTLTEHTMQCCFQGLRILHRVADQKSCLKGQIVLN